MKNILMKMKRLFCLCAVSGSCSPKEESKPDEYKVIMAGNVMVAQGYECSKCKVIRSYNQPTCNCP
jgi:hypothetical protein